MLIRLLGVIIFCLGLVACSSYQAKAPVQDINIHYVGRSMYHRVQRGETLYSIAWRYNKDYRVLARRNHLKSPYHIYPGQHVYLRGSIKSHHQSKPTRYVKKKQPIKKHHHTVFSGHRRVVQHQHKIVLRKTLPKKKFYSKKHHNITRLKWVWPAKGRVGRQFSSINKGIDIGGVYNEPIYAAANGVVVYAGNGIRDFKNLILIKHNELLMTAYAHNTTILVKEGQRVKAGQQIARMGSASDGRIILHFEIRKAGKSVNPSRYFRYR